eukprot:1186526-Prorocentrum_minimum.AAC.1
MWTVSRRGGGAEELDPYVLGLFLGGAYQETMGSAHNLFGTTNVVSVRTEGSPYGPAPESRGYIAKEEADGYGTGTEDAYVEAVLAGQSVAQVRATKRLLRKKRKAELHPRAATSNAKSVRVHLNALPTRVGCGLLIETRRESRDLRGAALPHGVLLHGDHMAQEVVSALRATVGEARETGKMTEAQAERLLEVSALDPRYILTADQSDAGSAAPAEGA